VFDPRVSQSMSQIIIKHHLSQRSITIFLVDFLIPSLGAGSSKFVNVQKDPKYPNSGPSFVLDHNPRRLSVGGEDVRVTLVEDSHGGAAEELSTSGSKLDLFIIESACKLPPKQTAMLLLRGQKILRSPAIESKATRNQNKHVRCFQQSGGRCTWRAWSSTRAQTCGEEECFRQ
jgi:hypothetical protein